MSSVDLHKSINSEYLGYGLNLYDMLSQSEYMHHQNAFYIKNVIIHVSYWFNLDFFIADNVHGDNTFAVTPVEMAFPSSKYT